MARFLHHWLTISLAVLMGVPILVVGGFLLTFLSPQLQSRIDAENRTLGAAVSAQVDAILVDARGGIERLGEDIAALPASDPGIRLRLDILATTDLAIEILYLLDSSDRVVQVGLTGARRSLREDFLGLDFSAHPYVREARRGGAITWSDSYLSARGEIAVAVAVPGRGRMLVAELNLRELSEFVRHIGESQHLMAVLVDKQNHVVAHPDARKSLQQDRLPRNRLIDVAGAGREATGEFRVDGIDYVGTAMPIRGVGWVVLVMQPAAVAYATQRTLLYALIAGILVSLLMALGAALLLARTMSRRMQDFSGHMRAVASGDYHADIPHFRITEFNEMADSMRRMAASVLERESRLQLAASVFNAGSQGVMITGADERIISVNPALTAITGYAMDEVVGKTPALFRSGRHDSSFYRAMMAAHEATGHWQGEIWNRRKNGEIYPEWLTITAVKDAAGVLTHYIGSFLDVSESKDAEDHIEFLVSHDALTQLPNRTLLDDRIRQAIITSRRQQSRAAILLLELDRFKLINDTLGHDVGDRLLEAVAGGLTGILRETETVARLGGDEFIVLMPDIGSIDRVSLLAQRILAVVAEPRVIGGNELHVTPSLGISIFPDDGNDAPTLLRNAETAMYHAKSVGRNNFQFFTSSMNFVVQERMTIENDLRRALENDEFKLYYQPQVNCRTGAVSGMEALIRWQHPGRGLILPNSFISIAEETGLIVPIGEWVLYEACRQARQWHDLGQTGLRVGVNLSARQFQQPELFKQIAGALKDSGLPSSSLELEITESMLMEDPDQAAVLLRTLAGLGIRLAIDDFGTGYSSLAYLKRFPLHRLKIDRSFVRDITSDPNDAAIVSAVVGLAASLNMDVIAEGVESVDQLRYLERHGCVEIQGYFFSRPQPASHFTSFRYELPGAAAA